jgi:hypothetical protein
MEQWQKNLEVIMRGGGSPQARTPREKPVERNEEVENTYILMRFYDGGALADFEVVSCTEEELEDCIIEFEEDCGRRNVGTHIGFLELDEFKRIAKDIKG